MRYYVLIIIALISWQASLAQEQSIRGVVLDENEEPLIGASVYFDGTTLGVVTDRSGRFNVKIAGPSNATLVVSFVGYEKFYIENPDVEKEYTILLKPDVTQLDMVTVVNNPFSRKQLMKAFKEQFIGKKSLQRKCELKNPEALVFRYNPQSLTFTARAKEPLIIRNEFLGYDIRYDLVDFQTTYSTFSLDKNYEKTSVFSGTSKFTEIENSNKIQKRREKAFANSTLSFFRGVQEQDLGKYNFQLYYKGFPIPFEETMRVEDFLNMKKVKVEAQKLPFKTKGFRSKLQILHDGKEQSSVSFFVEEFYIDSFGINTHFNSILFSGNIADKKMALMLPADYGLAGEEGL